MPAGRWLRMGALALGWVIATSALAEGGNRLATDSGIRGNDGAVRPTPSAITAAGLGPTVMQLVVADPVRSASPRPSPRSLLTEYQRLLEQGCLPERFEVATPIEARVLRNVPYARAGLRLASTDLNGLYAADGDWFRPQRDQVELGEADRACVARLARHEHRVRVQLPIAPAVEAALTRDAAVFWALRRATRFPNAYRDAWSRQTDDGWFWGFVDGAACGGDGSSAARDDCVGVTAACRRAEDGSAVDCEVVESG